MANVPPAAHLYFKVINTSSSSDKVEKLPSLGSLQHFEGDCESVEGRKIVFVNFHKKNLYLKLNLVLFNA